MVKEYQPMTPQQRNCQWCSKPFTVTLRKTKNKKFCSISCRVMSSRAHAQWLRDHARDEAYAQLTMKLWHTQKENRAIQERDEYLVKQNERYAQLLDEIASTLPRLIATGWLSVNRNNPDGWDWQEFLKQSPVNWDILLNASDTFHPLTDHTIKEVNHVEDTNPSVTQHMSLTGRDQTVPSWDDDDNQQDIPIW
ncbi:hypothetical protein [Alloscardovia omnicolens]|uniref:hypothetical protein n=1 Tax=Alloscardovia omnicolens TaxID=419015 RepID=UPI003A781A91